MQEPDFPKDSIVATDPVVESPGGISPPGAHRTVRESLNSYGSCHPAARCGFALIAGSSCNAVGLPSKLDGPTPLLRPHYQPSSLVRVGPPQCLASVLSSSWVFHLDFSLAIETTGSRSSLRKPETESRHLYAEHRPPSNQISDGLRPGRSKRPQF